MPILDNRRAMAVMVSFLALSIALAGCIQSTASPPKAFSVAITDSGIAPAVLAVPIGTTVTWNVETTAPSEVSFVDGESGLLDAGESYARTFSEKGAFEYTVDGIGSGKITVR